MLMQLPRGPPACGYPAPWSQGKSSLPPQLFSSDTAAGWKGKDFPGPRGLPAQLGVRAQDGPCPKGVPSPQSPPKVELPCPWEPRANSSPPTSAQPLPLVGGRSTLGQVPVCAAVQPPPQQPSPTLGFPRLGISCPMETKGNKVMPLPHHSPVQLDHCSTLPHPLLLTESGERVCGEQRVRSSLWPQGCSHSAGTTQLLYPEAGWGYPHYQGFAIMLCHKVMPAPHITHTPDTEPR